MTLEVLYSKQGAKNENENLKKTNIKKQTQAKLDVVTERDVINVMIVLSLNRLKQNKSS